MSAKRLYRSGKDKVLGGVCGGIAEYLDVDPVIIRLIWIFLSLISLGAGILVYLIAWIIIPMNPKHDIRANRK
jgi:phage shock protein C